MNLSRPLWLRLLGATLISLAPIPMAVATETTFASFPPAHLERQTDQPFLNAADPSLHDFELIDELSQVTSVSQLSDVQPTDWAFQALQSLVERYGCIAGYPDATFRGNRATTRYELAAALNACLDNISDRFATQEDLEALRALQEEFAAELATLRGRVDALEARTATLEAQQFSTTTKLTGEALFAFGGLTGKVADNLPGPNADINGRVSFTQRTRLNFLTSFTGKDRLFVRLQTSNRPVNFQNAAGTTMTRLSFDTGNNNNTVVLDRLDYMFPIGDRVRLTAFANAAFHHYYATTINPYFEGFGGSRGSISFFGERNPIYRIGTAGYAATAGLGATVDITPQVRLDVGYLAGRADRAVAGPAVNPAGFPTVATQTDAGLFSGSYSALAQLSFKPYTQGQIGLTYVRNHAPDGHLRHFTGSGGANVPFVINGVAQPLNSDSVGLEGSFGITDRFAVGGWAGYTRASQSNGNANADILNFAVNLAFPDLLKEGALGGLIFGMPPKKFNDSRCGGGGACRFEDPDTGFHIEALYQFPVTRNITITPGIIYLINPNHNNNNGDVFVGVVRTTFSF
ncbi:iron uptake porin [Synechococcales cyanobacterium C]|uniref:Iron uptake porin n=1 Tax=Petrachloros mirabilis ULC683 TaxID=2781853 RepID=A0A8K1ZYB7_9CYAN|nr:iron uptake porin [Petrachloros mirabilis]NCJ06158.1 iron uptake porin [Petrachloros mirabilis ULC683]